jgi:hypothetical protein
VISKATNGFSAAEVDAVIRGDYGNPTYRSRFELIDRYGTLIREITDSVDLRQGGVTHNAKAADIKRQASITFRETTIDLDSWLNTVLATSPLAFWRLADTTTTVQDATGNGRTATLHGGYTQSVASLVAGDATNASTVFNGSSGYADIAHASWMDVTRLSIGACVQTGSASTQFILGHTTYTLSISTGQPVFVIVISSVAKTFSANVNIADNIPHYVLATYDGAFADIYVDGVKVLHTAQTGNIDTSATSIYLAQSGAGAFFNGTLDEIAMWNRGLTAGEARAISQRSRNDFSQIDFDTDYIRCFGAYEMPTTGTDGTPWAEWPTFTGKLSSPSRQAKETGIYRNCSLSDLATLLKNNSFTSIYTVAAGENYITGAHGILAIAALAGFDTSAWAVTATTFTLPSSLDFQIGTSLLDAINALLLAINYRPFRFNGAGLGIIQPYVLPEDRAVEDTFNIDGNSIVIDDIEEATEIDQTSNTVVVTRADQETTILRSTATNSDVTSATSTGITGRVPTLTKQIKAVPDQTTLDNLGLRFLAVSGLATRRLHLSTLPRPFHGDEDKITFTDLTAENALNISKDTIEEEWFLPFDPRPMTHILRELDV